MAAMSGPDDRHRSDVETRAAGLRRWGEGGIERWYSYPIVLWLVAFGHYLLATGEAEPKPHP